MVRDVVCSNRGMAGRQVIEYRAGGGREMNDVTEYAPVVQKLLERTREGKVAWQEITHGFGTRVQTYEFQVSRSEDRGDITITVRMMDDQGAEIFQAALTDDPATLGKYRQLVTEFKELFELARRKVLNVEEKLQKVRKSHICSITCSIPTEPNALQNRHRGD